MRQLVLSGLGGRFTMTGEISPNTVADGDGKRHGGSYEITSQLLAIHTLGVVAERQLNVTRDWIGWVTR